MLYPLWTCRRVTVLWLCVLCLGASGPACAQVDRLNALITSGRTDKPALDQLLTSLSEEQREQCVAALVTHLESSDWRHREAAAYVAGQLGPKAGPIARQLIKAMACDMSNVAWEVAPALGKIGAAAVPAVIDELKACQALPDKVGIRVSRAMSVVEALGSVAVDAAPLVVPFLGDGHNNGSLKALVAIGPEGLPAVCRGLELDDARMPVYVSYVLSELQPKSVTALVAYADKAPALGRERAAWVFAHLKAPAGTEAAPLLCRLLADDNTAIAEPAAEALKAMGAGAANDVTELLNAESAEVRARAADVLGFFGAGARPAVGLLEKLLASQDREATLMAASTLLRIDQNHQNALKKLEKLLGSSDKSDRTLALRALLRAGRSAKNLVSVVKKLLEDVEVDIRERAVQVLGAIGPLAKAAVPELIVALSQPHPPRSYSGERMSIDHNIHRSVIVALGDIGPDAASAIPCLVKLLEEEKKAFLTEPICQALASMSSAAAPAVPALVRQLSGSHAQRAIETLAALGPTANPAVAELEQLLETGDHGSRVSVYKAISSIETDKAHRIAVACRYLRDPELAALALNTLAVLPDIGTSALAELLEELGKRNAFDPQMMDVIRALGNTGPAAAEALPKLIKDNTNSSYSEPVKQAAFEAIKKIDPLGEKTMALVKPDLEDAFRVRGCVELLEFLATPACRELAQSTRQRWKF